MLIDISKRRQLINAVFCIGVAAIISYVIIVFSISIHLEEHLNMLQEDPPLSTPIFVLIQAIVSSIVSYVVIYRASKEK